LVPFAHKPERRFIVRDYFNKELNELKADILRMGDLVYDELNLALKALDTLDPDMARQVFEADKVVNQIRFSLEEKCFLLIVTQQPMARDLRAIFSVANMIVDLERMGDQAKGIAKVIPHILQHPDRPKPAELRQMGSVVGKMLSDCMTAYAHDDIALAQSVAERDDEADRLYARIFHQIIEHMADTKDPAKVEATYEVLRTARELERFGDLATNIAERVIYMVTGQFAEINTESAPAQENTPADD
jgi:phosphate transport system protein